MLEMTYPCHVKQVKRVEEFPRHVERAICGLMFLIFLKLISSGLLLTNQSIVSKIVDSKLLVV